MAASNFEKNMNKEFESAINEIFKFLFVAIKRFFLGFGKLKKISYTLGLIGSCWFSILAYFFKKNMNNFLNKFEVPDYLQTGLYLILLCMPVMYLIILGSSKDKKQDEYKKIFSEIGFKGKDGRVPYFIDEKEQDKRKIFLFKSSLSLTEWRAYREKLETGLNCNILKIENRNSKKIVELITISSDYKIPDMLYWKDEYVSKDDGVIRVGQSALHEIEFNLNRTPHILIAGETGSGKSVILRVCLWQMIMKAAKVYMIDFKGGVEFGKQYEEYGEVITERKRAVQVLTGLCKENEKRLKLFRDLEVKNLPQYNKKTNQNLCRIGVFCDEIAEMLDKKGVSKEDKEIMEQLEGKISSLSRLSRATGINLFLGVQRPDANVLTGQIKNNVPVRISGRFADKSASEIVLGNTDAVNLPDIKGRFLFKLGNETEQFQSYFFDDDTMLKEIDIQIGDMLDEQTGDRYVEPVKSAIKEELKVEKNVDHEKLSTTDKSDLDLDFNFENMWSVKENE